MTHRLPNFLIVGAPKSGTTSLVEYLMAHPQAWVVPYKEVHYFDMDSRFARGLEWYAQQFEGSEGMPAVGEGTAWYLFPEKGAARMAATVPDAKLIAILRNPVDRAYSQYWHERFRNGWEWRSFEEAITGELAFTPAERALPLAVNEGRFQYLEVGRYLPQLLRLCDHYPRESLLVLLLDDLEQAPVETFRRVCRFLGIDDRVVPDNVGGVANAYVEHRAYRVWKVVIRHRLLRYLPRGLLPHVSRFATRKGVRPPAMDPAIRAQLTEFFAEDTAALGEWLGRDLSRWHEEPPAAPAAPRQSADRGVKWWLEER